MYGAAMMINSTDTMESILIDIKVSRLKGAGVHKKSSKILTHETSATNSIPQFACYKHELSKNKPDGMIYSFVTLEREHLICISGILLCIGQTMDEINSGLRNLSVEMIKKL